MNINVTLIAQAVTFAAFIWVCARFLWPVLTRAIEARQKTIADGLAAAERGRQDLEQAEIIVRRLDGGAVDREEIIVPVLQIVERHALLPALHEPLRVVDEVACPVEFGRVVRLLSQLRPPLNHEARAIYALWGTGAAWRRLPAGLAGRLHAPISPSSSCCRGDATGSAGPNGLSPPRR